MHGKKRILCNVTTGTIRYFIRHMAKFRISGTYRILDKRPDIWKPVYWIQIRIRYKKNANIKTLYTTLPKADDKSKL